MAARIGSFAFNGEDVKPERFRIYFSTKGPDGPEERDIQTMVGRARAFLAARKELQQSVETGRMATEFAIRAA